jgi:hypothetical protein
LNCLPMHHLIQPLSVYVLQGSTRAGQQLPVTSVRARQTKKHDSAESRIPTTCVGAAGPYRQELVAYWQQRCSDLQVPVSQGYSLSKLLVSPVELRDWALQGLPTDSVSVDNGTLVTRTHRWPLMIDPQEQGRRWVTRWSDKGSLLPLLLQQLLTPEKAYTGGQGVPLWHCVQGSQLHDGTMLCCCHFIMAPGLQCFAGGSGRMKQGMVWWWCGLATPASCSPLRRAYAQERPCCWRVAERC